METPPMKASQIKIDRPHRRPLQEVHMGHAWGQSIMVGNYRALSVYYTWSPQVASHQLPFWSYKGTPWIPGLSCWGGVSAAHQRDIHWRGMAQPSPAPAAHAPSPTPSCPQKFFCFLSDYRENYDKAWKPDMHLRKRMKGRSFICDSEECETTFIRDCCLKSHMLIHVGQKLLNGAVSGCD